MRISKQKVMDTIVDILVVSAVLTFLWNLILPVAIGVSAISFLEGLSIVAHIFGVWHLIELASSKKADDEPAAEPVVINQ